MDELAASFVHEDVRDVAIAETDHMTNDRGRRDAARVVESHVEPESRDFVLHPKVVTEERRRVLEDLAEGLVLERDLPVVRRLVPLLDLPQRVASLFR